MNPTLKSYHLEVQYPEGPAPELLQTLVIRDGLAEIESTLSAEDLEILREADRHFVRNAPLFFAVLSEGIDFAKRRRKQNIPPEKWWWYLDVLAQLPEQPPTLAPTEEKKPTSSEEEAHAAAS